jgi:4-hydroxy-2-oxovalerate aldolase
LDLANDYGMRFVRIGTNITQSEEAEEYIKYAKEIGLAVSYNAMKSYVVSPEELTQRAKHIVDWGADVFVVVDSAGGMLPLDVKRYVESLRSNIDIKIGFHGHNSFMLANANNLAALESGATVLDSTMQGIGRGGGNAQTEIMLVLYEKIGINTGVDKYKAMDIGEEIIRPLMKGECGVRSLDVTMGYAFFHSSFLKRINKTVEEFHVDIRKLIIEVSKIEKVNPTEELIRQIACNLSKKEKENLLGAFIHE